MVAKAGDNMQVGASDDDESKQVGAMAMAKTSESKLARARRQKQATMVKASESKQVRTCEIKTMMTKRQWWK